MPGFFVENFGCRATQADGAALQRQFEERGLTRSTSPAQASIVILNTCTVTSGADQDARAAIRRVRRQNPDARIVVTGCYAQRAPEEIAALPGVDLVIGNSHKHQLAEIALPRLVGINAARSDFVSLDRLTASAGERPQRLKPPSFFGLDGTAEAVPLHEPTLPDGMAEPMSLHKAAFLGGIHETYSAQSSEGSVFVSDIFAHTELLAAPVFEAPNERTRPNLKIQDGCDNRCSFCVIPYVRGQSRSLGAERILQEVNTLVKAGYREVVISGINLGRWGRDLERHPTTHAEKAAAARPGKRSSPASLVDMVRIVLKETVIEKLRISSVEPMDWIDDLISLVASSPRIAKHAHVPMQSGSDAVLRRMHRKYRPWHYREKIQKIHAAMPQAAIGADVMVGFPGETDAEFESTRKMIEELPFTYLHVFTYSARPGTPAAEMPKQVPVQIARERNRILRELAAEKKLAFMRGFVGKEVEAITLNVIGRDCDAEFTECLTDNYLKLRLRGRHEANRWRTVAVRDVAEGCLMGRYFPVRELSPT